MGEAITLVLADMIFVDNLRKAGVEYDWSKRKIYPLLEALDLNTMSMDDLRTLLHANMRYGLFGDDSEFLAHLKPEPEALFALEEYKAKYGRFFAEDWRWTAANYDNMREQEVVTSEWVEATAGIDAFIEVGVPLLSHFTTSLSLTSDALDEQIADAIFDHLVDKNLGAKYAGASRDRRRCSSFKRVQAVPCRTIEPVYALSGLVGWQGYCREAP